MRRGVHVLVIRCYSVIEICGRCVGLMKPATVFRNDTFTCHQSLPVSWEVDRRAHVDSPKGNLTSIMSDYSGNVLVKRQVSGSGALQTLQDPPRQVLVQSLIAREKGEEHVRRRVRGHSRGHGAQVRPALGYYGTHRGTEVPERPLDRKGGVSVGMWRG
ncbi:hypothetical protein E2C01_058164 [Portunus trituberculatus]|uniref:Uncharacterized protein n=1 Tax=Portunus trituberculatus TaxID=210409 RepID=A0A5B7H5B9_PORTR|nr:hypothetical protein [Portunus trituberculatus]